MPKISAASRQETGHRRAGRYWPPSQTTCEVTDEQLAEMKTDDQLVLVVHDVKPEAPAKGGK
jgi:hypothetical protein